MDILFPYFSWIYLGWIHLWPLGGHLTSCKCNVSSWYGKHVSKQLYIYILHVFLPADVHKSDIVSLSSTFLVSTNPWQVSDSLVAKYFSIFTSKSLPLSVCRWRWAGRLQLYFAQNSCLLWLKMRLMRSVRVIQDAGCETKQKVKRCWNTLQSWW